MKITHISHACLLIEADGVSILSDPWWRGPCFGSQWWLYPSPYLAALENKKLDYIYISHAHADHFHPATLKTLSRDATVLVPARSGLEEPVRAMGFPVISVRDEVELGATVRARMMETQNGDTLLAVTDGREVCINLNDALHSAPANVQDRFIAKLRKLYPVIDYVFCGYGVASHFPNCYDIPGKDAARSAAQRQQHFNRQWARIVKGLRPIYAFPFAADVVLLDRALFWANEPTHNAERPTQVFKAANPWSQIRVEDIAPGFVICDGVIESKVLRKPVTAARLEVKCAAQIDRANRHPPLRESDLQDLVALMRANIEVCGVRLRSRAGDWRLLIEFHGTRRAIGLEKRGNMITAQAINADEFHGALVRYVTKPAYLRLSLTEEAGCEILFVGSGGVFHFSSEAAVQQDLHLEMRMLLQKHATAPSARPTRAWKQKLKVVLKRLIGRSGPDLYDLMSWTVYR